MSITLHSHELQSPFERSAEARRAALAGTRAMIADEQFAALVTFLIDLKMCSGAQAGEMVSRLAERLTDHGSTGWQTCSGELRLHAGWLKRLAAQVWRRGS